MGNPYQIALLLCFAFSLNINIVTRQVARALPNDPTDDFVELPFNTSFYHIQKPYDLPVNQRYSFIYGVHKLWVYSTDKPLSRNSPTKPRTEIIVDVSHSHSLLISI